MLSLILAFVCSFVGYLGIAQLWPGHPGWTSFFSVVIFVAVWILINLRINKSLEKIFKEVQSKITSAQDQIRRELNMFQQKGQMGRNVQEHVETKLKNAIHDAILILDKVKPLRKWNWLAGKQADTMKAQLLYQTKEYEEADKLLDKALILDPMILAMKIARMYKKDQTDGIEKTFKRGLRRFKGEKTVILYALYSWILVKQQRIDEAVVILDEAKLKTDSPVLKENWEHLANGRVKRFSNAGLGDAWYGLNLEEPKQVRIRQQPQQRFFR